MSSSGECERRFGFGRSDASARPLSSEVSVRSRTSRAGYVSRGFVARLDDNDPDFGSDRRRRAGCTALELAHDVSVASVTVAEGDRSGALDLTFVRDGSRGAFGRWRLHRNVGSTARVRAGRRSEVSADESRPVRSRAPPLEGHRAR
jgi:hypothetical protein